MRTIALVLILSVLPLYTAPPAGPYRVTRTFTLGGNGGWDYVVPDPPSHRLFIGRSDRVMVVDENSGKLLGEVTGIKGAHGVAVVASEGRGFATAGQGKEIVMFDLTTYKTLGTIPAADDADAIIYDDASHRVLSFNGDANNTTIVDPKAGRQITNLALGGKPEYGAAAGDGKVYINLTDKAEIVEVDATAATVLRRWPTTGCKSPVAMAIDTKNHRLFSGCRSGVMAVSDYQAGTVVATVPIGTGVDGAGYDPATGNAFASNGEGTLTVIHQDTPDKYSVLQTLQTQAGSRNMGLDPTTHKIYLPAAKFGPAPAGGRGRGPMEAGSFGLLVVEK
jgi:DNA-binding beta-propeller fold protein YncE